MSKSTAAPPLRLYRPEQPLPVHTKLKRYDSAEFPAVLSRYWRPEDAARCSLCPRCSAGPNVVHPELLLCFRFPGETLTEVEAPLYRTEWGDFPFDQ